MTFYHTCPALEGLDWLIHGSTTRQFNPGNNSREKDLQHLAEAWNVAPDHYLYGNQKHTVHIHYHNGSNRVERQKDETFIIADSTDAVGTEVPGILVCVFTADCVPVFLVDTQRRRVMLVHAGWRGTHENITGKAIRVMVAQGTDPEDIIMWAGPAIGRCCYEVSPELSLSFVKMFRGNPECVQGRMLDLKAMNRVQALRESIRPEKIHISPFCTRCRTDLFYSYRAEGGIRGRILSAAMIRKL